MIVLDFQTQMIISQSGRAVKGAVREFASPNPAGNIYFHSKVSLLSFWIIHHDASRELYRKYHSYNTLCQITVQPPELVLMSQYTMMPPGNLFALGLIV